MNDRERFLAVARFEKPDYLPIFGFTGAPGMSGGAMKKTHDRLVATGMPGRVGGCWADWKCADQESWYRYWGTTGAIDCDIRLAGGAEGFRVTRRTEGNFVVIESENGAVTREVLDNSITYSMPEHRAYPVRDRASWEFYKARTTPRQFLARAEMETRCRAYDQRTRPLVVGASGGYGMIRGLMGPEGASLAFYDDPEMIHDMVRTRLDHTRNHVFPLIERLRPEVVLMGEDLCYNHGMLLSPRQFDEFFGAYYQEVCDCAKANGATLVAVDTDGNAMEFTGVAARYGVNAIFPYEVKAGNDLFTLRRQFPRFVLFGWLEKETVNEGNEKQIEPEIRSKVPPLIDSGGYFPNGDHGIQPFATFPNLCRFMTVLHEVCNNPEGEFPRTK